jgi:MFS family permease
MSRPLILGISIVSLANALLGTLVSVMLSAHGLGNTGVGLVMSCYWLGYIVSALTTGSVIERIGHVRAFTAFAATVAASVLALMFGKQTEVWALCRVLTGYGCAALFMVTESWLSASSTSSTRGTVFGTYMLATYICMGAGQFLLNVDPSGVNLLTLDGLLFAVALIPVALVRDNPPPVHQVSRFGIKRLVSIAPVSALVCAMSGLASGAFYGMIAPALRVAHEPTRNVSFVVASLVFGGLVAQLPVGRLSDSIDRRLVMTGAAAGSAVSAMVLARTFGHVSVGSLCILTGVLGACLSVLYPLAVAHVNDRIAKGDAIPASGALILVNGTGSLFGPALAGLLMRFFGADGLFGLMAFTAAMAAAICFRAIAASGPALSIRPFLMLHGHAMLNPGLHPHLRFRARHYVPETLQTPAQVVKKTP